MLSEGSGIFFQPGFEQFIYFTDRRVYGHHDALWVDEKFGGQLFYRVGFGGLGIKTRRFYDLIRPGQSILSDSVLPVGLAAIEAYAYDFETVGVFKSLVMVLGIKVDQTRVGLSARPAPACPEVNEDVFTLEIF